MNSLNNKPIQTKAEDPMWHALFIIVYFILKVSISFFESNFDSNYAKVINEDSFLSS